MRTQIVSSFERSVAAKHDEHCLKFGKGKFEEYLMNVRGETDKKLLVATLNRTSDAS